VHIRRFESYPTQSGGQEVRLTFRAHLIHAGNWLSLDAETRHTSIRVNVETEMGDTMCISDIELRSRVTFETCRGDHFDPLGVVESLIYPYTACLE
jgi:hypothetical protein